MSTNTTRTRIKEIIWCEGQAEQAQHDADSLRWTAAKLIFEELATGKTQRQVAEEIGKTQPHVSYMYQVHKIFSDNHGYQERSFDSCYQEVKNKPEADLVMQVSNPNVEARHVEASEETGEEAGEEASPGPRQGRSTCGPINPFKGFFEMFKQNALLTLTCREIREDIEKVEQVQRALDRLQRKLNKIRKDYYHG